MQCLNCGNEFEAKRSTAKYCSNTCRWQMHEKISKEQANAKIPNAKANAKKYEVFADLPDDVRERIDSVTAWCKLKNIEDDREARIERALKYQRLFGEQEILTKGVCRYCGEKIDDRLVCCGPCAWGTKKVG